MFWKRITSNKIRLIISFNSYQQRLLFGRSFQKSSKRKYHRLRLYGKFNIIFIYLYEKQKEYFSDHAEEVLKLLFKGNKDSSNITIPA